MIGTRREFFHLESRGVGIAQHEERIITPPHQSPEKAGLRRSSRPFLFYVRQTDIREHGLSRGVELAYDRTDRRIVGRLRTPADLTAIVSGQGSVDRGGFGSERPRHPMAPACKICRREGYLEGIMLGSRRRFRWMG